MAYAVKYRLEYQSRGIYTTKIDILKRDYVGEIIELIGSANPFNLVYDSDSVNQFSTFKSSYAELEIKLTEAIKTDFIEIEDEDDFILRYYRNEILEWSGYILQEQYQEGDDNNQPFVSLKFYDGISRLKIFNITDTILDLNQFSFSLGSIFQSINELLYSTIGSTGFIGNDFLVVDQTEVTPNNCYSINIVNNSLDFIDVKYNHCITGVEETIFINPDAQATINCVDCNGIKLNNTLIGSLCSVDSINQDNVIFTVLSTSDNTCNVESQTGTCYEIVIQDSAKESGELFLYIETQEPNQEIVNKAYFWYESSDFDVNTQAVTITICSVTTPVFRYGATGEAIVSEQISVTSGGTCSTSEYCITGVEPVTIDNIYDSVYVTKSSLFDKDGNSYTLFEILQKFSNTFNFTYLLYKDSFAVHSFEFSKNPQFIDFGNAESIININHHTTLNANQFWINKSKGLEFLDSLKKMEIYHKFDDTPSYLITGDFTDVVKLREYVSAPDPTTTSNSITFNTFSDIQASRGVEAARWYRDVSVTNATPFIIQNDSKNNRFRLSYNIRFVIDYGITDLEFEALTEIQKYQLENKIKEIEANTDVRFNYQVESVLDGVSKFLKISAQPNIIPRYESYNWIVETNAGRGLAKVGLDTLIEGYDYSIDISAQEGLNEMYLRFFQPYVVTNIDSLSTDNEIRIEGVNMIISDLKLVKTEILDVDEIKFEGVTNRNVFNYNLNRDKEISYINLEEIAYKYNLLSGLNTSLGALPFRRKEKDYSAIRPLELSVQDLILTQSLEQFGFQQQYITGDLMVRDNSTFDIFSTIEITGKTFAIGKFNYQDKAGVYQIDLVEIK
ncbi:hypothetical protein SYJ56_07945 [Algoriphagus sp. D3-2-R+10]|uniref:hypothetical protein n=1 Tax=Algoriphagus aurantiacus TaxID=3103948 RepID=UPI002B39FC7C|nr:hypothetical protein [Algoriphagus sp. D3-2-R+10]MEB2775236.1 hypothetical protein [Algoriphagus sp. D3-2-R+10]